MAVPLALGLALPLASFRPNRIAAGESHYLLALHPLAAVLLAGFALAVIVLRRKTVLPLAAILLWLALMGWVARDLALGAAAYARVTPGPGFWSVLVAMLILLVDALAHQRPGPLLRLGILAGMAAAILLMLHGGLWDSVSYMQEYRSRSASFWREARTHLTLALGSFAAATVAGFVIGALAHRLASLRAPVVGVLTLIQTIPSIAMFGMLMLPLGWLAAQIPALGISGIGMAPAFVALFLYALLPMVANTLAGLSAVPANVTEAARGMGMTGPQRFVQIELPLALPILLTGARIVLVQNIGLATVGALIGAGGFGTFVFQGLGQTASDLILLGALPTVALAFAAAVVFDAVIEMTGRGRT
ncbi:ABC transporter permease subunit [Paracoccus sp. DK608]|uniref:ABC transporter permease subunit n=2 Tax=Paracoccus shanxieyensis TaxID=2675752 RepID=A0A6L6IWH5_9RHOB|nr:ABC transporter permease [Paracoccus shanxieyensis]MTH64865.1 ABC transporter permease subunit [Paracoccus shanxieyensis]MTH87902.1 ABC transporter permease subunit [Paracoccus shanxieyensis]